jgi:hypothetical protein
MWTKNIALKDGDEGAAGYGTITYAWDDPAYAYSEQGNASDLDGILARATAARDSYIAKLNAEAEFGNTQEGDAPKVELSEKAVAKIEAAKQAAAQVKVIG